MESTAQSVRLDDDIEAVFAYTYAQGWTDGLPIIPPTEARVARMLAASTRGAEEVVALLPPLRAEATVRKIAINAVMAGCLPEYFPTVITAVEAVGDPHFELYGINTTTNPVVPFIIVNGPIRHQLDINCSWSVLGPSKRSNATIGRALSLVMINLAGRIPEQTCKATWKMPGAYTMCAGEYEEESPWEPLHVERGFDATTNTVTLLSPNTAINIVDTDSQNADELLKTLLSGMISAGSNNTFPFYGLGEIGLMLSPGHARVLAEKYNKQQIREYLLEHLKLPVSYFSPRRIKMMEAVGHGQVENGYVRFAKESWQFLIFVAGGLGGYHSAAFPTFGDSRAITLEIKA